jgi:predicted secreted protein
MLNRKSFISPLTALLLILGVSQVWAGDTATFVDLGFSPDGRTFMFAQYGIQNKTLRPWADLFVVDVPRNDFVAGGKFSYTHDSPTIAGQDGLGALFRLISKNTALTDRYSFNFLTQGQPLYISLDEGHLNSPETIEFRDFEQGASYRASLVPTTEGTGSSLKSAFFINLERTARDGSKKSYTVGNPQVKRPLVTSYRIRKVMIAPRDGSIIFIIEMKKMRGAKFDPELTDVFFEVLPNIKMVRLLYPENTE